MKIKLSDLKPNPYRDLKKYPIKQDRVDALKASIEQTGFWDNVLARPAGKTFELAYGHNRLIALQQLGVTEIDIPVKDIPDADMVRIMATENREQYDENQAILIETVQTVRDYLNRELAKCKSWDEAKKVVELNNLFKDEPNPLASYGQAKGKQGIGRNIIIRFLGKGWKEWKITHALEVLNSTEINPEAVKKFESTGMGSAFTKAVKEINKESSKPVAFSEQLKLAEKISEQIKSNKSEKKKGDVATGKTGGGNYYSAIKDIVKEEYIIDKFSKPAPKKQPKENIIKYESVLAELRNKADDFREGLRRLLLSENELGDIEDNLQRRLLVMSLNSLSKQINLITNTSKDEKVKQINDGIKCITE